MQRFSKMYERIERTIFEIFMRIYDKFVID